MRRVRVHLVTVACASALTLWLALAGVARADITATEGQSFSGEVTTVGTCEGFNPGGINWGDGTSASPATIDQDGVGGDGTHTYAEEGTYAGTLYYTCGSFVQQMKSFQATVADAALTGTGRDISGTAGQRLTGIVAHVDDANPAAGAGDFTATIHWGDGSTTAGSVSVAAGGGFDVTGTHTYATTGSFTVGTSITDAGGSTTTGASTGRITGIRHRRPPTASFTVAPEAPCGDQEVEFDASASSGGSDTINRYVWTIVRRSPPGDYHPTVSDQVTTGPSQPVLSYVFQSYALLGRYLGQRYHSVPGRGPVLYNIYDYALFNPPVSVTLAVWVNRTVNGHVVMASTTHTISFADPLVTQQVGYAADDGWAIPGFAAPTWLVAGTIRGNCKLNYADFFGATANRGSVALAALTGSPVSLVQHSAIKLHSRCSDLLKDCLGLLDILPGRVRFPNHAVPTAVFRRLLAGSLGSTTFVVPAGRTVSVTVRLDARGRMLARTRRLRQVTLLLGSVGARGRITITSRTVFLVVGRTGGR